MAKPFKSEFDLMAEAYGTISYDKQQLINEDKAGRRVIGYPPQLVSEDFEDFSEGSDSEDVDTEDVDTGTVTVQLELDKDTAKKLHVDLMDVVDTEVEDEVASEEPVEGEEPVEDGENYDDLPPLDTVDDGKETKPIVRGSGSLEDRNLQQHELAMQKAKSGIEDGEGTEDKMDYGPSGEGKPVHPDEAAESAPGMNSRIDGMIDRDALGAAQAALQNILADLHANGEEFEADDVAAFIASTLS